MKSSKTQKYFFGGTVIFLAIFYGCILHENPFKALEEAANFGKILTGFVPLYVGIYFCRKTPKILKWSIIYNSIFLIILACVHSLAESHVIIIHDIFYNLMYHCEAIWRSLMVANLALWASYLEEKH